MTFRKNKGVKLILIMNFMMCNLIYILHLSSLPLLRVYIPDKSLRSPHCNIFANQHLRCNHCSHNIHIIRLTHTNVWERMGKPCSCTQFTKNRIFTLGHVRIRISTTTHARIHIRYYKSRVLREIKGSYDKINITIVPS